MVVGAAAALLSVGGANFHQARAVVIDTPRPLPARAVQVRTRAQSCMRVDVAVGDFAGRWRHCRKMRRHIHLLRPCLCLMRHSVPPPSSGSFFASTMSPLGPVPSRRCTTRSCAMAQMSPSRCQPYFEPTLHCTVVGQPDGSDVTIKVCHPRVHETVMIDLVVFDSIARLIDRSQTHAIPAHVGFQITCACTGCQRWSGWLYRSSLQTSAYRWSSNWTSL